MATAGPNVLFVVLDTVRKDRLSVYGHDRPTSPTLEAFADEARVYEEAVAPAPWTLPVHASMFTGLYPSQHGATQENPYLEGTATLAQSLSTAGYATCCYSSNAWITPYTHLTDGFDAQDNFFKVMPGELFSGPLARGWKLLNDHDRLRGFADRIVAVGNAIHERLAAGSGEDSKTAAVIDSTIECIDGQEPFFAFINLMDAHLPYHPPPEYATEFAPGVDSTAVCQNSKAYNCGARSIDEDEWDDIRGLYDAEIRLMDDELGRLFDWLKDAGVWEDTMVVVCADHGELHGEHDLYGHEFAVYDELVNVPLLLRAPGVESGRDTTTQVELLDLYHTILDATGVEAAGEPLTPGRSLLDGSYGDRETVQADAPNDTRHPESAAAPPPSRFAFVEYHRPIVELNQLESIASSAGIDLDESSRFYSRMRAARRPNAKYIRNERIADEAYRLDQDPGEAENRSGSPDAALDAAAEALAGFEAFVGGGWDEVGNGDPLADMGADAKARLQDLGYLE